MSTLPTWLQYATRTKADRPRVPDRVVHAKPSHVIQKFIHRLPDVPTELSRVDAYDDADARAKLQALVQAYEARGFSVEVVSDTSIFLWMPTTGVLLEVKEAESLAPAR